MHKGFSVHLVCSELHADKNNLSQTDFSDSTAYWVIFHAFLSSADFFQNYFLKKILSGIPSECQTVWTLTRPDDSSGLVWVQTVCQGYQQTTLVDKELINSADTVIV